MSVRECFFLCLGLLLGGIVGTVFGDYMAWLDARRKVLKDWLGKLHQRN